MNTSINKRWGESSIEQIEEVIGNDNKLLTNTLRSQKYVWKHFMEFCVSRGHVIEKDTSTKNLALILEDYAFNMRKANGEDYKESVIKTIWNVTAKLLQEKYFKEFERIFDPFKDLEFKQARCAKASKRKQLCLMNKRNSLSSPPSGNNKPVANNWDEDNPDGLQKKFFYVVGAVLGWVGKEAGYASIHHFRRELNNLGKETGRIEYNPFFNESTPKDTSHYTSSKWITQNIDNVNLCPVRLFNKLLSKRPKHATTDRLFLTCNPYWNDYGKFWYKNYPVGVNVLKFKRKTNIRVTKTKPDQNERFPAIETNISSDSSSSVPRTVDYNPILINSAETVCRSCLGKEGEFLSIFKNIDKEGNVSFADIINLSTSSSVNITENDGLSNKICVECSQKVLEFRKFMTNIENNEKNLKSLPSRSVDNDSNRESIPSDQNNEDINCFSMKTEVLDDVSMDEPDEIDITYNGVIKPENVEDSLKNSVILEKEVNAGPNIQEVIILPNINQKMNRNEVKKGYHKKFTRNYRLQITRRRQHFQCEKCHKTFRFKRHYQEHMFTHINDIPKDPLALE